MWDPELEKAFTNLKRALLSAPALKGMALGVRELAQQQMGYLSKELDLLAYGWLACLKGSSDCPLLIPEATKYLLEPVWEGPHTVILATPTATCLNLKPESTIPESNPGPQQGLKTIRL